MSRLGRRIKNKLRPGWGILAGLLLLMMGLVVIHFWLYEGKLFAPLRKLVWALPDLRVFVLDDILSILMLSLVTVVCSRSKNMTLGRTLGWFGLNRLDIRQVVVTLLCVLPLALIIWWSRARGGDVHLSGELRTRVHFLLVNVVFYEEIIFRGFFFRSIRARYPFWPACLMAGLAGVLLHAPGAVRAVMVNHAGVTAEFQWLLQILVYGASQAYLYERGGFSLWGCIILHFFADWGVYMTIGLPDGSDRLAEYLGVILPYALHLAPFAVYPALDLFGGKRWLAPQTR